MKTRLSQFAEQVVGHLLVLVCPTNNPRRKPEATMSDPCYRVRVTKDHLVFSAAHFITFNDNICERLHGHNWRTAVELTGPLDENRYVFDFIALRDAMQKIVNELDHHVLLPTQHRQIRVQADEREVTATFEARRWIFPREDCVLLPVENTTAEEIAHWIATRLREIVTTQSNANIATIQVEVEENFGQWAICQLPAERPLPADSR